MTTESKTRIACDCVDDEFRYTAAGYSPFYRDYRESLFDPDQSWELEQRCARLEVEIERCGRRTREERHEKAIPQRPLSRGIDAAEKSSPLPRWESPIFRWKNAVPSRTSFANWRTSKNALNNFEGTTTRKDEAFSPGGRPILSGVREDGTDPEWGWIQQVDRACSVFLLKRGILYREEDL